MGAAIGVKQELYERFSVQGQPVIAFTAPHSTQEASDGTISIGLADFVERRFIPEYVMQRRPAGRAHLYAILKHILSPERVDSAFHVDRFCRRTKLTHIAGWPYLDALPISEITPET